MISEHVQEFKQIELTPDEAGAFAVQAARLRYDDEFLKTHRLDYAGLLRPERREDQGADLWRTYNRVQEKLIQHGGVRMQQTTEAGERFARVVNERTGREEIKKLRRGKMRPIQSGQ